jgi:paraquat-inducible protein A
MHHVSSLLGGTLELLSRGNWLVGGIVLVFSIILPFIKMLGILELLCLQWSSKHYRAWVYRFVEVAGRWGMLDVLLLALMVMFVKLGNLVEFHLGPAVFVFIGCVTCNMLASLFFNPRRIWSATQQI